MAETPVLETPVLQTPRLLLPPLALGDAPAVQALFPRWEVVRFLDASLPWPYPPDGALSFIRDKALPAMREGREWHWSIRPLAEPERLIGAISLRDTPDENRSFWLDPAWQGRGLMTEATTAVTDYWFETLGKPILRVSKASGNLASRRISESSGMRLVASDERDYVSGRLPTDYWEITREEWRRRAR